VDESGTAKICDFGLVRQIGAITTGFTTTSMHTGTTRYLSYELVDEDGRLPPTMASDVHALGCVGMEVIW
jgi:serine/threonine protein kinase